MQNCVSAYTSDWVVVRRKYHHHSSSIRPIEDLDVCLKEPLPQQEFEIDDTPDVSPDFDQVILHYTTLALEMRCLTKSDFCPKIICPFSFEKRMHERFERKGVGIRLR